ncbi:DUF2793 domain-containing protein [Rhodobacter capsulatus]|jgi:hypothetical protein|uniref:DUF2793 domain-containing protein n=3 Tax=root TaxID=1 RepID=D5AL80_RHOCB|nr:DUF2793 domain-containing protein [Rhodobacter capsulatus]DBA12195.1 TPA_asm: tail fiber protein [Rhodobactegtaviriform marrsi]ADE83936.1 conserved hypothetical protein [Rhodobacter capsulatus SB 1003]ETD03319.1 hypothetical protein U714_01695 [Rhodobacter capsulatus DE442]ETD79742.1 hypothetical protein U717_01700 [Rhodobacter capsulatus R121]ETE55378.1 hypothetical protein U715_01695 [Rhodobacter capsulatus Y262]
MADQTPLLGLPLILPSQAQKHVTHNEALSLLDAIVQLAVLDRVRTAPPASPQTGDRHIVAPGGAAAWTGQDGAVALWTGSGWLFAQPQPGWTARDLSDGALLIFDGSLWGPAPVATDNLPGLGINTTHDTTNRLAVQAAATLLSHAGAGHQLKINKALPTDTASLLFQTSWSGRAEMGTTGSDSFAIKVSADGTAWKTAFSFAGATGLASGLAVQQSRTDVTAGRLMRADWGYGPGNLLGTVAQSAGVPTGAVLERGTTANGEYIRFADGTQICFAQRPLGSIIAQGAGSFAAPYRTADVSWTYPKVFSAAPVVTCRGVAPVGLTQDRRLCAGGVGDLDATAATGIHVVRLGGAANADVFKADLIAIGPWV